MRQLKISKSITNRESLSIEKYLHEIAKFEMIGAEDEVELARKIKKGDREAIAQLTKGNLRFVVSVAKQYQNQGMNLCDLINEGNLGLIKAAQKFDETRGFKFISYAVWWIRQSILQAINENSRMVRLPSHQIIFSGKMNKFNSDFEKLNERLPTMHELSEMMQMSHEKLLELIQGSTRHVSLDAPLSDEAESGSLVDVIASDEDKAVDKGLIKQSLLIEINRALQELPEREQDIIRMCYGIGGSEVSIDDIGNKMNLTRERVRQLRETALGKLRSSKRSYLLKEFLG